MLDPGASKRSTRDAILGLPGGSGGLRLHVEQRQAG
jgi:hypothetical protein